MQQQSTKSSYEKQSIVLNTNEANVFAYNQNNVSFKKEKDSIFINATEMSKPFNKSCGHWLRNQSTKEFISHLSALRNCKGSDLVRVENGLSSWLHEDVALEFARWLNPTFSIWCNDRIKELGRFGFTATPEVLENIVNNPDLIIELATALKTERSEKEKLQIENSKLHAKTEFVDLVFNADDLLTGSQVCKILKLPYGNKTLYKTLRERGVFFKNKNEPKQALVDRDYFRMKEIPITQEKVKLQTYFTQKGLAYIAKFLNVLTPQISPIKISNS